MSSLTLTLRSLYASAFDNTDVGKRSKDSAAMMPFWEQVGDIVKGKAAIQMKGETYLPKFANEQTEDYETRLKLVKFTNVYRDIVESLANKPFEKEVTLTGEPPEAIKTFAEDVDGSGNDITVFAVDTFFNGINDAVDWIFVDFPAIAPDGVRPRTRQEERELGIRPFWTHIRAENVLEATSAIINGKEEWVKIRIFEPGEPNRIRVMTRDATGAQFELYVENTDNTSTEKTWILEKSGTISIGVIPMVMFNTGRRDGRRYFFYPPMRDAADLQIELYQQESGSKFIRNLSAYPMLAGQGVNPEMDGTGKPKPIGIGPMRTLYARINGQGQSGKWEFIQPDAAILTYLKEDVKETIQQLRELGRQPLTAQSGNLTVITTAVAANKAKSAVAQWAFNLKNALENALLLTVLWMGSNTVKYDPVVEVYTEFDDFSDTGEDLTALHNMRKDGDLSQKTYWKEMKRRKVLSDDFDEDDEIEALLDEVPGEEDLDAEGNPLNPQQTPTDPNQGVLDI